MCQQNKIANRSWFRPLYDLPRTRNLTKVLVIPMTGCCVFRRLSCWLNPPNRKDLLHDVHRSTSLSTTSHPILHAPDWSTPLSFSHLVVLVDVWWIGGEFLVWHIKELQISITNSPPSHTSPVKDALVIVVPIEHCRLERLRTRIGRDPNGWGCKWPLSVTFSECVERNTRWDFIFLICYKLTITETMLVLTKDL
jgi:hypothetical protein